MCNFQLSGGRARPSGPGFSGRFPVSHPHFRCVRCGLRALATRIFQPRMRARRPLPCQAPSEDGPGGPPCSAAEAAAQPSQVLCHPAAPGGSGRSAFSASGRSTCLAHSRVGGVGGRGGERTPRLPAAELGQGGPLWGDGSSLPAPWALVSFLRSVGWGSWAPGVQGPGLREACRAAAQATGCGLTVTSIRAQTGHPPALGRHHRG